MKHSHSFVLLTKILGIFLVGGLVGWEASTWSETHAAVPQPLSTSEAPNPLPSHQSVRSQDPSLHESMEGSLADLVDRVIPAVVTIYSTHEGRSSEPSSLTPQELPGRNPGPRREGGLGSGVVVSADGVILTNNHVVEGATELRVVMSNRHSFVPVIVGVDRRTDVAVLRIPGSHLPFLSFADSSKARVGDLVLAIGNPLGVGETVSKGILSAKGRSHVGIADYEEFLQTDAAINPGNSGGALVNSHGELLGINTAIASSNGAFSGIGFAIPSNMAHDVMDILLRDGKLRRGQMGVSVQDMTPELAKSMGRAPELGALVSQVIEKSPAEKAGVKRGDIVVTADGRPVETSAQLRNYVALRGEGTSVKLVVWRDGETVSVSVLLGKADEETGKATPESRRDADNPEEKGVESGLPGIRVTPASSDLLEKSGLSPQLRGLMVTFIDSSKASAFTGLLVGDLVVEVNRKAVTAVEGMRKAVRDSSDSVLLSIRRKEGSFYIAVPKK